MQIYTITNILLFHNLERIWFGTGDLAEKLNSLGTNVKGIDNSESMIQQARNKYPHIEFSVEDAVFCNVNS